MIIQIHNPELESLLQQRTREGNFASVESMLLEALRARDDGRSATLGTARDRRLIRRG